MDIPSVYGSARGLSRTVCISAPATPNAAPASSAVMACGSLSFQIMDSMESGTWSG